MTNQDTAQTILAQLGGNKFIAMTGAKNLLSGSDSLSMKLGRGAANGITHLTVTLVADEYHMHFQSVRGMKVATKAEEFGVYADQMRAVFTARTGFDTSL